jgi:predicted lipid-binding transport protein (Tim44 family)
MPFGAMVNGSMNEFLSPSNLVLAGIAVVIFWRLWAVLGTRTGAERPPVDYNSPAPGPVTDRNSKSGDAAEVAAPASLREPKPVWTGVAAEGSDLALVLEKIAAASPGFNGKQFLAGARTAYEMVVEAFAGGDKATLKSLLSSEVLDGFIKAIEARAADKQKLDFRFIGFEKAEIAKAELEGKRATIDVRFVSQIISATYDAAQQLLEGDPNAVRMVTDLWSFERDISQSNPNWRVVSTESLG